MNEQNDNPVARRVVLVSPHGFCAGVERAVKIAEHMLKTSRSTVYCLKEIVHNKQIVADLTKRGMVFVKEIGEVPRGATVLLSAHGVAPDVRAVARRLELNVVDASCPFVTKVHTEVRRYAAAGYTVLLIGHKQHDEIIGVAGEAPASVIVVESEGEAELVSVPDPSKVAVMTQTTLSVDEVAGVIRILRRRFPLLETPRESDICYATQNRQMSVRSFSGQADIFIVLGARNSSNSNRLVEVARAGGCRAFLVSEISQLAEIPLEDVLTIGMTAGASTPQYFVKEAVARLGERGFHNVEEMVFTEEDVHFSMPAGL